MEFDRIKANRPLVDTVELSLVSEGGKLLELSRGCVRQGMDLRDKKKHNDSVFGWVKLDDG